MLCDPNTREPLFITDDKRYLKSSISDKVFPIEESVIRLLDQQDDFYEGSYLNKIKYVPRSESFIHSLPLWLISNGYLWEVRKQFKEGSTIIELGCAGGVDYFGKRYNMIGLDLSFQSLKSLTGYQYAIQADATKIPLADHSVDGVISSYFWEHIPPVIKDKMLAEFRRVLKPGGKIVFLYDVETENTLVSVLKNDNPALYKQLFIDKDGHLGYETPLENSNRFLQAGYKIDKHFGMERTWLQSNSVYEKLRHVKSTIGKISIPFFRIFSNKAGNFFNMFIVRLVDCTIGRLLPLRKSRIIISVISVPDNQ